MNKTKQLYALLAATALASTATVQANLVINGGFESHPAFNQGSWGLYGVNQVPGWNPLVSENNIVQPIELGTPATYGVSGPGLGTTVMELDSNKNVVVGQIVGVPGATYTLSFQYARRSGVAIASTTFDVYWNGVLIESVSPTSTIMSTHSELVTLAMSGSNSLEFRGTGTSDSLGALIDNVAVVPEPSTYVAGGLALLPLLFGLRSRFAKK